MPFDAARLAPLPACLEVPAGVEPKARYALAELLRPLGLRPAWTDRAGLAGGGLYYGEAPDAAPARALRLRHHASTAAFFAAGAPYAAADASTLGFDGEAWPVLFPRGGEALSSEPFEGADLVASAFVWLSGWQEATTRERDVHGRAPYAASLQAALDREAGRGEAGTGEAGTGEAGAPTVLQPVVDAYRERLAAALTERGVALERLGWGAGSRGGVGLTVDVDHWRRRRLGYLRRAARGLAPRSWRGLAGPDPFQRGLDLLLDPVEERGGVTVFVKAGASAAEDVPYRASDRALRHFLERVQGAGGEVGLHPSYFAHDHAGRLAAERARLADLAGHPIRAVRQHYLRHDAARTARLHVAAGFAVDSTLGFAEHEGFRRATTFPFRVYDLAADAPLDLWEAPVHAMDTTLFQHRGLAGADALAAFRHVVAQAERFGGLAVLLWHNTLGDALEHPGRAETYADLLDALSADLPLRALSEALASWA